MLDHEEQSTIAENAKERASNSDDSDRDNVSLSYNFQQRQTPFNTLLTNLQQDNFEDADSTPLEQSHSISPTTSTRSLTNPRTAVISTTAEKPLDVPAAPLSMETDTTASQAQSSQPKSPLLTSHRLSTTSLDNVSLDGHVDPKALPRTLKGM
jgi:hypothetical protein